MDGDESSFFCFSGQADELFCLFLFLFIIVYLFIVLNYVGVYRADEQEEHQSFLYAILNYLLEVLNFHLTLVQVNCHRG